MEIHVNMNRKALFAAIGCLICALPLSAMAQNNAGSRATRAAPLAPDGTLGMALLSAEILSDGTVNRGSGVVSAVRENVGTYRVQFDRNVTQCVYVGSLSDEANGFGETGYIGLALDGGSPTGIYVETRNVTPAKADFDFALIVFCHQ
jgi:hypothetical protein